MKSPFTPPTKGKEQAFLEMVNEVTPRAQEADQALKQKLMALDPPEMGDLAMTMRHLRNEADLFRQENIPLLTELTKLSNEYDKITGRLEAYRQALTPGCWVNWSPWLNAPLTT